MLHFVLCECYPFVGNLIKTLFGELGDSFSLFQFFAYDYSCSTFQVMQNECNGKLLECDN